MRYSSCSRPGSVFKKAWLLTSNHASCFKQPFDEPSGRLELFLGRDWAAVLALGGDIAVD